MPLYGRCWLLGAICSFACFLPRPVPQEYAPFASLPETLYFHEEMIFAATLMWGPQTLHYPGDKWVSAGVTMPPLNILPLPPTEPTNPPLSDFNFTMLNRFVCLWEYEDSGWGKIPLDHLVNHQKPSQRPQHWVKEVMAKCLLHFSLQAKVWVEDHLSGEGKHSFFRSWQNKNSHPSSFWFPFQEFLTSPFIPSEIFLTCPARAEVGLELFWKFIRLVPWAIPKGPYTPAPAKGPKTSSFFHKFLHI